MTIQEACQRLGKSESTIRRWIRSGKLIAAIIDGIYDIPESVVNALSFDKHPVGNDQEDMIQQLRDENQYLKGHIQELESARERTDTIILQLTHQLEQNQRLLEYHKEPFWQRWFRRKKGE